MSIIYDALKKIERLNGTSKDGRPIIRKRRNYWWYIFVICLGVFITGMFTGIFKNKGVLAKNKKKYISKQLEADMPAKIVQNIPGGKELSLILNGVFFSEKKGYALINNEIFKEGDFVDGARINSISLDEVVLEIGGNSIRLVNRK